ncbi:MAG TPA: hypothetical protein VNT50_07845 [Microbacterium sp.]|uniref:hypothetical protein n=1 Tax=Microbacterium sp. TaxID=51671 RepID=UPI002BA08EF1|nr:hypothetical protein [Microbacterium sp.]HWI31389.1 hypothetical protein [Microbacterium sp.]
MSGATNEYEEPGGNYPDKGGTWSGPVPDDSADSGTQDGPIQDMNAPTLDEKLEGIIAQTRADVAAQDDQDVALLVRRRLEDAGIPATDDDISRIVARVVAVDGVNVDGVAVGDADDVTRIQPGVHPET